MQDAVYVFIQMIMKDKIVRCHVNSLAVSRKENVATAPIIHSQPAD